MKGPASWKGDRAAINKRAAVTRRARVDGIARKAHVDYMAGLTMNATARKHGTDKGTLRIAFRRLGLFMRPFKQIARQANGSPVRYVPKTDTEIRTIIEGMTMIKIPDEIRFEWRSWSMERRRWFISILREKLKSQDERPQTPFSSNLEPFEYGSPKAVEIARQMNRGRDSRTKAVVIRLSSQGVIYKGRLFFWSRSCGPAYFVGPWREETGRPPLHHIIWEETNGPIPEGHVVRHADGNRNNLDPDNLVLATRNDVARENQATHLIKKSRRITALLLDRSQKNHDTHDTHLIASLSGGSKT